MPLSPPALSLARLIIEIKILLRCSVASRLTILASPHFQIPPIEKDAWKKGEMSMESKWEMYEAELGKVGEHLPTLNEALKELEGMIHCPECCTEGGFSYDDVDLWSRLRSLTLIKGAEFPPGVMAYLINLEKKGDVPLYFGMQV